MNVLIRFSHGLGDAVQLTCVLQHLARHRPDWVVDVATLWGKHTAYRGLCRRSLLFDDPIPAGSYDQMFELGWFECYSIYGDSPCTKTCSSLREVFGITPEPSLLGYRIDVGGSARLRTRDYLRSICNGRGDDLPQDSPRYPVVAIHY